MLSPYRRGPSKQTRCRFCITNGAGFADSAAERSCSFKRNTDPFLFTPDDATGKVCVICFENEIEALRYFVGIANFERCP